MSSISAIHAGLRQLGIEQDDARDLYDRQTGKRSLRDMKPVELESVVKELRRLGFKQDVNPARKRLEGRFAPKLQALWIAGWNLGLVRDRRDEALIAFVRGQTGIDHIRFLTNPALARAAIEGLKGWLARDGGVDWSPSNYLHSWAQLEPARIVIAQWRALGRDGDPSELIAWAERQTGGAVNTITPQRWAELANRLGAEVRKART